MYRQYIKKTIVKLLLTTSVIGMLPYALADKADLDKEIVIKAKRQAGDLKNKIASYLDDVRISQGSLVINADLVQVLSEAGTDNKTYIATGKPATLKQKLDDGSPISLQADEIKYEPAIHTITITGNAQLSQEGSEVNGSKIIYNTLTEQLEAESNQDEEVTTILQPRNKDEK